MLTHSGNEKGLIDSGCRVFRAYCVNGGLPTVCVDTPLNELNFEHNVVLVYDRVFRIGGTAGDRLLIHAEVRNSYPGWLLPRSSACPKDKRRGAVECICHAPLRDQSMRRSNLGDRSLAFREGSRRRI